MKKGWILGLVSVLLLAACSTGQDTGDQAEIKTLNIPSTDQLQSVDVAQASTNIATFTANMNIYNGLMTYDLNNELIPADASAMPEVSEDGLVYTFTIRDDATWSNGSPVTAQNYVDGWQRMVDPELAAPYSYMYNGVVQNATEITEGNIAPSELGVAAIDDKKFQVTLEQPTAYFLDLITIPAFYPVYLDAVESTENYGTSSEGPVYNGPFEMTNWEASEGSSWTLTKNDDYWDAENVNLDEVVIQHMPETSTAISLYESGELDVVELTGEFAQQYEGHEEFQTYPLPRTNYIELNHEAFGLENLNIRQAIYQAIDREAFTTSVLQNGSVPINGQVSNEVAFNPKTNTDFREDSQITTDFDLEAAQANWQAGLEELGVEGLTYELLASDDPEGQVFAEYIQSQLMTNLPGIEVTIRTVPSSARFAALSEGSYELGATFWQADFGDPINYLERFHTDITRGNYSFEDVDDLIDQSREQSNDPMARWETLIEVEQLALDEYALQIPVYQSYQAILQKSDVTDINRPGQSFTNYRWANKVTE